MYADSERHNTLRYRRTGGRTDRQHYDAKRRSHWIQYDRL